MIGLKLLLILLFNVWPLQKVECETVYMIPPGGSCQGAPTGVRCLTLEQYYNSPSSSSNILIELQPGNHTLLRGFGLQVVNVDNFTLVSNGGILDCSQQFLGTGPVFGDGHFRISIIDSRHVYIGPITIIDCHSYIERVEEFVVEGGSFHGTRTTRRAIALLSVSNAIIRGWSCSGYTTGCLGTHRTSLLLSDSTFTNNHAVVSMSTASSLTVERCSFRGSNVGVFYTTSIVSLAITNSTFSNTSATRAGGVIHHESGSGRFMISSSNFTNNSAAGSDGGALYFREGGPFTVVDSNFISNSAGSRGGAVHMSRCTSTVTITNSLFTNNLASHNGGAVYSECGSLTMTDSYFHNNSATAASGGALYSQGDTELILSTFTSNVASMDGGSVSVGGDSSSLLVNESIFFNNTAIGGGGGAIHYSGQYESVSIVESNFSYNTALFCGIIDVDKFFHENINFTSSIFTYNRATGEMPIGEITCIRNATVFIVNSTLSHNSAAQHAGVFSIDGGIVTIVESSFINNSAGGDGGVMYTYYYPTIYSIYGSTFSQNTAGDDGGVLFVGRADSEVRIYNSLFTDNNAIDRGGIITIVAGTVMINRTNLLGNTATSGGIISACNSRISVENARDLQMRVDPVSPICMYYSGDVDRYDLSIPQNYGMIESITPPVSWQCDSFRIEPIPVNDCPVELTGVPCITLEDYYYNPSVASNIYIELQPGNHSLLRGFGIAVFNIDNFTMVSNGGILDCSEQFLGSGPVFGDGHFRISIIDSRHVYIGPITVIDCHSYIERVEEFVVEGGSFHGTRTTRRAIALLSVSNAIIRGWSCSGYTTGCLGTHRTSLLLSDSTFTSNHGVVSISTTSFLTVERCLFRNSRGSGVLRASGTVSISILCSTFINNMAQRGSVIYGYERITVNIEGSSFYNNTAATDGGVIYMYSSTCNIAGSNFSNNSAGGHGGVLYLNRARATVHNSTFANNDATNTGGVTYATRSTFIISETNFLNNTAANGGGVIRACDSSRVTLADDLQTGTASSCTLYNGNIDLYNMTYNYCPDPSDALTSTVGPQVLAVCSIPTYIPSTTNFPVESHTTNSIPSTTNLPVESHTTTSSTLKTTSPPTESYTTTSPQTKAAGAHSTTSSPLSETTSSSVNDQPTDVPLTSSIMTDVPTTLSSLTNIQDESMTTQTGVDQTLSSTSESQSVTVSEDGKFTSTDLITVAVSASASFFACIILLVGSLAASIVCKNRSFKPGVVHPTTSTSGDIEEDSFIENKGAAVSY